jgi:hypothetical protein
MPQIVDNGAVTERQDRFAAAITEQLALGRKPPEIARRMHPHDPKARRSLRLRLWKMLQEDDNLLRHVAGRARAVYVAGLIPASEAMVGRAARGRVDAGKLVLEVTGLHNPRVQHEHSGKINISLTIPRPDRDVKQIDEPVVDADVVED